jgi:hypothetical protein
MLTSEQPDLRNTPENADWVFNGKVVTPGEYLRLEASTRLDTGDTSAYVASTSPVAK